MPRLVVDDLRVEIKGRHGTARAVDGVSFAVAPGEFFGLVGESGCGKSMTLRAILGVLPPGGRVTGGSIRLDGVDLLALSGRERRRVVGQQLGMVFQEPLTALNPVVRVGTQIAEGALVAGQCSRAEAYARARELMALVGIPDPDRAMNAFPHELSGGMRQRVVIAIALSCRPKVLLCDEPTTALDVTIQDQVLKLIRRVATEVEASVVFITHDLPVVAQLCTQVAVMYAGQIVERGELGEVFAAPRHHYTLGLLRSLPQRSRPGEPLIPLAGSPPSPIDPAAGCRFLPRCGHGDAACAAATPLVAQAGVEHATACVHPDSCRQSLAQAPLVEAR